MAAYYHAPRRQLISSALHSSTPQHPHHQQSSLDLTDSSTYIFPNPPSAPPSPYQSSDLSDPSELSFSVISVSEFGSQPNSPWRTLEDDSSPGKSFLSPLNLPLDNKGLSRDLQVSTHPTPVVSDVNLESANIIQGKCLSRRLSPALPRPKLAIGATQFRQPLVRASKDPTSLLRCEQGQPSQTDHPHPLPCVSIPFLSFFSTLLGIDDSTLDLLTSSSTPASILFSADKTFRATDAHGVEKLFSVLTAEIHCQTVREGLLSLDPPPAPAFSLTPFSSLWDLVSGIVSDGSMVLLGFSGAYRR